METKIIETLVNLGIAGIVLFFGAKYGLKALEKLYNDMKEQHKQQLREANKREDKLMEHLNKVVVTLETINNRLCVVEKYIKKGGADNDNNN